MAFSLKSLMESGDFVEGRTLLKNQLVYHVDAPLDNEITLSLLTNYAKALYMDPAAVPDDLLESIETYEKCLTAARRLWGSSHPYPTKFAVHLGKARARLAAPQSSRFERALKRTRKD